jgi:hypothetical protein
MCRPGIRVRKGPTDGGSGPGTMEGTVPLSEHERCQLEQIEAALRAGDPRFGAVRAADPRVHYRRRVIAAALGFLAGVGLLLAGVVVNVILIAVAGFVVMLACTLWAVTSYRRMTGSTTGRAPPRTGVLATNGAPPGVGGLAPRRERGSWGGWKSAGGAGSRAAAEPRLPLPSRSTRARRPAGQVRQVHDSCCR